MSLKSANNPWRSFVLRLTLWYALLFCLSLGIIFLISFQVLSADLKHIIDRELMAATDKIEEEFHDEGLERVRSDIREGIEAEGKNRVFFRLLRSNLNVIVTSDPLKWPCLNFPQMSRWASEAAGGQTIFKTLKPPDRNFRIRIISRGLYNGQYILQIGKTMRDEQELSNIFSEVFGVTVLVLLLSGIGLAWLEARRAMAGVKRITSTAVGIIQGNIKNRVAIGQEGQEIEDLAGTFNRMLDRIEVLMTELKDVTHNVAHDLRTPITRIRGLAEATIHVKDPKEYQETMGIIVEECDRLVAMISIMLEIAEAEAGLKQIDKTPVDLASLVRNGCELFLPMAQDKGLYFETSIPETSVTVMGHASLLQRVISNLLDNAIKFTDSGGKIMVEVQDKDKAKVISIKDTGFGISPHDQDRIFEKFYRVESSRSAPGHGLGLSFVRSMVQSMGGTIVVESALGQGSHFILTFPAS